MRTFSIIGLLVAVLVGCSNASSTPPAPPAAPAPPSEPVVRTLEGLAKTVGRASTSVARPACLPWVNAHQELILGETRVSLPDTLSSKRPELRVFPHDEAHVRLAFWQENASWTRAETSLWQLACQAPEALIEVAHDPKADFFHAAMSADGERLFLGGHGGLRVLERDESAPTSLNITAPTSPPCANASRDRVLALLPSGQRLRVVREARCDGAWHGLELELDLSTLSAHQPHPVRSVAVDGVGTLFLAEGGRCDVPGVVDPGRDGAVYVSRNQGEDWMAYHVPEMSTPATRVLADPREAGHVLVQASTCQRGDETVGGELYTTRDGGETWRAVSLPEGVIAEALLGVERIKGVSRLRVHVGPSWQRVVWETLDGGASWAKMEAPSAVPAHSGTVRYKGLIFKTSGDGLLRFQGRSEARVFPQRGATGTVARGS